jgi:glutaredoxin-like YruB-family protein
MNVVIFSTPTCGYCHQAKRYLQQKGIPFVEHDVSVDRAAAEEMVRLTNQMGVPVILVDREVIIGFDRPRLDELLASYHPGSGRVSLGASVADAMQLAPRFGLAQVAGALVGAVSPGSPAFNAGLREGDIIQEFNRQPVEDASSLAKIMAGVPGGGYATIVFVRNGQRMAAEARF